MKITISKELATDVGKLLKNLKSPDDTWESMRLDVMAALDLAIEDNDDFPDFCDAREN